MSILRKQQIDEILDADNHIYRQVMDRQKTQAQQFNEETKEKSSLETSKEIMIDTAVEQLSKLMEEKNMYGENLMLSSFSYDSSNQKMFNEIVKNTDVIQLYNKIVNSLNSAVVDENNKSALKVEILKIKPFFDSMSYILYTIISILDNPINSPRNGQHGFVMDAGRNIFASKFLPRVFTAYALIRTIQKQLERNSYKLITPEEIDMTLNKEIDDYRASHPHDNWIDNVAIPALNDSIKNKALKDALEKRIKQMQDEQGHPLSPAEVKRLQDLYFGVPLVSSNLSPAELQAISDSIYGISEAKTAERERRVMAGLPADEVEREAPLEQQEQKGETAPERISESKHIEDEVDKFKNGQLTRMKNAIRAVIGNFVEPAGGFSSATAYGKREDLIKALYQTFKFYLNSQNKSPVGEDVINRKMIEFLNSYNFVKDYVYNLNRGALNPGLRNSIKDDITKIKGNMRKIVDDAFDMNVENYRDKLEKEEKQALPSEAHIFTGQGKPFDFHEERNEYYDY